MRARGKVGLYFITGIKETQNGTRAAPTRARITSPHSHSTLERSPTGEPDRLWSYLEETVLFADP